MSTKMKVAVRSGFSVMAPHPRKNKQLDSNCSLAFSAKLHFCQAAGSRMNQRGHLVHVDKDGEVAVHSIGFSCLFLWHPTAEEQTAGQQLQAGRLVKIRNYLS